MAGASDLIDVTEKVFGFDDPTSNRCYILILCHKCGTNGILLRRVLIGYRNLNFLAIQIKALKSLHKTLML